MSPDVPPGRLVFNRPAATQTDEATKAPPGLPDTAAHSARRSGSNSKRPAYGACRHCPREDFYLRDGRVPRHHRPPVSERGPHPICPGSDELPAAHIDAADGSDLLEA